jgi:hypothetical protein
MIPADSAKLCPVERLKSWLRENNISIVYPGIGDKGMVTLRLHPASGNDFEIAFYTEELEANPDNAIETIADLVRKRRLSL